MIVIIIFNWQFRHTRWESARPKEQPLAKVVSVPSIRRHNRYLLTLYLMNALYKPWHVECWFLNARQRDGIVRWQWVRAAPRFLANGPCLEQNPHRLFIHNRVTAGVHIYSDVFAECNPGMKYADAWISSRFSPHFDENRAENEEKTQAHKSELRPKLELNWLFIWIKSRESVTGIASLYSSLSILGRAKMVGCMLCCIILDHWNSPKL